MEKFTPSVTISLAEYEELKLIKEAVDKKKIIFQRDGYGSYCIFNETELTKYLIGELIRDAETNEYKRCELLRLRRILDDKKIPYELK